MRELRYAPDQPRDAHGRFGEGSGETKPEPTPEVEVEAEPVPSNDDIADTIMAWQAGEVDSIRGEAAEEIKHGSPFLDENKELVNPDGHNLLVAIRQSTYISPIFRGLAVDKDKENTLLQWKVGQEVQITPASFSSRLSVANSFASESLASNERMSTHGVAVIIDAAAQASDGNYAHGVTVNDWVDKDSSTYWGEHEVISGGKYVVTDMRWVEQSWTENKVLKISVKQIGCF